MWLHPKRNLSCHGRPLWTSWPRPNPADNDLRRIRSVVCAGFRVGRRPLAPLLRVSDIHTVASLLQRGADEKTLILLKKVISINADTGAAGNKTTCHFTVCREGTDENVKKLDEKQRSSASSAQNPAPFITTFIYFFIPVMSLKLLREILMPLKPLNLWSLSDSDLTWSVIVLTLTCRALVNFQIRSDFIFSPLFFFFISPIFSPLPGQILLKMSSSVMSEVFTH